MKNKFLIFIFFAGLVLRLIALNQSLWLDEATTAQVVSRYSFIDIIRYFSPTDFHPPFYYLFMKAWTLGFGVSEISLRMPSVLFSLAAGYVVYKIGGKKYGLWASAFFLFNPLMLYYSQEARMYSLITFLLSCALYLFLTRKHKTVFDIVILISLATFYGSVFFIAALGLYAILASLATHRQHIPNSRIRNVLTYIKPYRYAWESFTSLIPGVLTWAFLLSPLLFMQFENAQNALSLTPEWRNVLGAATFKNAALIPLKFSIGRVSWEPKMVYYAVAGVFTAVLMFIAGKGAARRKVYGFLAVAPLGMGLIVSFYTPMLAYFRFIYLVPLYSLLLAIGTRSKVVRSLILAGFVGFSLLYSLNPQFHREDWRGVVQNLKAERVYMVFSSSDPLQYYASRENRNIQVQDLKKLEALPDNIDVVTVIPYTADIHGVSYETFLQQRGFMLDKIDSYRGITVETWVRAPLAMKR